MAHDVRPVTAPLSRAPGAANGERLYVERMFDNMMVCGTPRRSFMPILMHFTPR